MAIVIKPPKKPDFTKFSVFLCGSIDMDTATDWQAEFESAFKQNSGIILFNPRRDDWDSSWKAEKGEPQFDEQVNWELECQEKCDLIAVFIAKDSKAPITLLEIGLFHKRNMIVCCEDGFYRKGNIDIVCERYKIPQVKNLSELIDLTKQKYLNSK